jgi:peptidyl-prolyl cis-trans isomerase D
MFDFVTKHKRLLMVVLCVLIIPPFAFFGIDFYFRGGDAGAGIATVAGTEISQQEFGIALSQAQDRMREAVRNNPQLAAQLESPQFKESVLNDLIERRVVLGWAAANGMRVSDAELRRIISGIDAFRDETGKFSGARYERLLRAQNMSPAMFENRIRQDILLGRIQSTYAATAFLPEVVAERLVRIREQRREVSQALFEPTQFMARVNVSEQDARKYYDEHPAEFRLPERARVEYVVLTPQSAAQSVTVSDAELRQAYEGRLSQYQTKENRAASHILIAAGSSASAEEKATAKSQAEDLANQLRQSPSAFGALARKFSQDPGSAEQGGSLGEFERGFMAKPIEDAVFGLKKAGEITGPIETQYGYHIIRLDGIKPVVTTPFEKVKSQLLEEVQKERAQRAYTEAAQTFSDMVYEQFESLKPVAEALKLTIQKSDWISKTGGNIDPMFNNAKLLEQIFSSESVGSRRNTEAVEVQPNVLLSARVVEHLAASAMPFEEVRSDIIEHLRIQGAVELAEKEGRAALEDLRMGKSPGLRWSPATMVTLVRRQGLHDEGVQAVFGADVSKLPAYAGVATPQGRFVIYRVTRVEDPESVSPEQIKSAAAQINQILAQEQFTALVASLRERAGVRIDTAKLNPTAQ